MRATKLVHIWQAVTEWSVWCNAEMVGQTGDSPTPGDKKTPWYSTTETSWLSRAINLITCSVIFYRTKSVVLIQLFCLPSWNGRIADITCLALTPNQKNTTISPNPDLADRIGTSVIISAPLMCLFSFSFPSHLVDNSLGLRWPQACAPVGEESLTARTDLYVYDFRTTCFCLLQCVLHSPRRGDCLLQMFLC